MNLFNRQPSIANANDSSLVMYSLGGDRDAFCQIVTRYQNLLCSLAYSAVGDFKHSEDIAQDVFVDAWKKLDTLQEPAKLKAWLCGMLRFKVSHFHRKEKNQPIKNAQEIETQEDIAQENSALEAQTINAQEQEMLWRVLDSIDDTYREPLVLFYREQQSIARVAEELDLSPDTVKQRLSRGRNILKKAMSTFVEDALKSSKPGVAFTTAVMGIVSSIAPPAKAAALGAGAAKASSVFKLTTILTFLAAFSGLISTFFGLRSGLDLSRTERERKLNYKSVSLFIGFVIIYIIGMFAFKHLALTQLNNAGVYAALSQFLVFIFIISYFVLVIKVFAEMKTLRAQERIFNPDAFQGQIDQPNAKQREYISKLALFGVPLIHMQFGLHEGDDKAAFGWIAGGTYAKGLLFAWGGVAIAPISVGIISFGIFSLGAVGIGLFGVGTVAIGIIGFGASSIAYKAYGSLSALGWESAFSNGFSIAKEAAIGTFAYADITNNEQAAELVNLPVLANYHHLLLAIIAMLVIIPSVWHSRKVRQRMK